MQFKWIIVLYSKSNYSSIDHTNLQIRRLFVGEEWTFSVICLFFIFGLGYLRVRSRPWQIRQRKSFILSLSLSTSLSFFLSPPFCILIFTFLFSVLGSNAWKKKKVTRFVLAYSIKENKAMKGATQIFIATIKRGVKPPRKL